MYAKKNASKKVTVKEIFGSSVQETVSLLNTSECLLHERYTLHCLRAHGLRQRHTLPPLMGFHLSSRKEANNLSTLMD